ncbi:hypothetical protein MRX96_006577 [Rhipicephalus microplus]
MRSGRLSPRSEIRLASLCLPSRAGNEKRAKESASYEARRFRDAQERKERGATRLRTFVKGRHELPKEEASLRRKARRCFGASLRTMHLDSRLEDSTVQPLPRGCPMRLLHC